MIHYENKNDKYIPMIYTIVYTLKMEIIFIIILVLSVVMHELAHGFAADFMGDPTPRTAGRLTLNPVPHIDVVGSLIVPGILIIINSGLLFGWAKPVPYNPYNLRNGKWGEILVVSAGCLTNFLIAIIFAIMYRFSGSIESSVASVFAIVVLINLFLGILNLIPIPPLDGSKILSLLLPVKASIWMEEKFQSVYRNMLVWFALLFIFFYLIIGYLANFIFAIAELLLGTLPF